MTCPLLSLSVDQPSSTSLHRKSLSLAETFLVCLDRFGPKVWNSAFLLSTSLTTERSQRFQSALGFVVPSGRALLLSQTLQETPILSLRCYGTGTTIVLSVLRWHTRSCYQAVLLAGDTRFRFVLFARVERRSFCEGALSLKPLQDREKCREKQH